jgi:hypothetical protein
MLLCFYTASLLYQLPMQSRKKARVTAFAIKRRVAIENSGILLVQAVKSGIVPFQ